MTVTFSDTFTVIFLFFSIYSLPFPNSPPFPIRQSEHLDPLFLFSLLPSVFCVCLYLLFLHRVKDPVKYKSVGSLPYKPAAVPRRHPRAPPLTGTLAF